MLMGQLMSQIRASSRIKSFNFKCTICKMSFARSSTLKVHQKTHEKSSGSKPTRSRNDKIITPEFIDETDDDDDDQTQNDNKKPSTRKRPSKPLKLNRLKLKRAKIDVEDKDSTTIDKANNYNEMEDIDYDSSTYSQLNNDVSKKINFDPIIIMNKLKPFKCQFCPKFYPDEDQLKVHLQSDHNHKIKSGKTPRKSKHKRIKNDNENQVKMKMNICSFCSKSFSKPSDLTRHVRIHTLGKPFQCPTCSRSFSRKDNLSSHMKTHQGVKLFKCKHCQKSYSRKSDLYTHKEKVHSEKRPSKILRPNQNTEPVSVYQCSNCPKTYTTTQNLRRHERSEHDGVKFRCQICGEFFTRNDNLDVHYRKFHKDQLEGLVDQKTGQIPKSQYYKTTISDYSYDKIEARDDDGQDPSSNENQYKCPFCDDSFRKRKRLKKHIDRSHLGVESPFAEEISTDFSCSICSEIFLDQTSLSEHIKEHDDNEVNYICEFCQEAFKKRKRLQKHINNFHLDVKGPEPSIQKSKGTSNPARSRTTKKAKSQSKPFKSDTLNLFYCPMCPKKFSEHEALIKHSIKHRDFFLTL